MKTTTTNQTDSSVDAIVDANVDANVPTSAPAQPAQQDDFLLKEEFTSADFQQMFGRGRYHAIQCEAFKDARRIFGLDNDKAMKIAKALATHLGSLFASSQATLKGHDKLNNDGKIKSLSDAAKLKNVTLSDEIAFIRACDHVNKNAQFHVAYDAKPQLTGFVADWVKGL